MSWQVRLANLIGPGLFTGSTHTDFFRILRQSQYQVSASRGLRLMAAVQCSLVNSRQQQREIAAFGDAWETVEIRPPLFILGHWRSGTTHLHNLIAQDRRFAFPNLYQVLYPHSFLTTEASSSRLLSRFLPQTRFGLDNVRLTWQVPYEEEFALAAEGWSTFLTWAWPQSHAHYDRFLTLRDVSETEVNAWRQTFIAFLKKLTFRYQKPLVLKSPPHTGRIRHLLALFPQAKFIHIHRNPYDVFLSRQRLDDVCLKSWAMHSPANLDWDERILSLYQAMYAAYDDDVAEIPPQNRCEVRFEDLEQDPMQVLRDIYESLALPSFADVEEDLRRYVTSLTGYRKNRHARPSAELRRALRGLGRSRSSDGTTDRNPSDPTCRGHTPS